MTGNGFVCLYCAGIEILTLAKEKKDIFNDSSRPLTANEIFAGDDEFYQLLSKDIDASAVSSQHPQPSSTSKKSPAATTSASPQRLSRSTIAIRVGIGLIAAMLLVPISLYCVSSIVTPSPRSPAQTDATHAAVVTENVSESASPPAPPLEEPVSWKLAQSYYKKKDYAKASSIYSRLSESLLLSNPTQSLWNDYLNLKLALCAYKLKETALSKNYLAKAIQSSSPATVALSNYYLAFIKNEQRHYSDARLRAYKALAMLETIDQQYSEDLIADCYFLIAQTLTADALLGRNQKLESPANWPQIPFHEPLEQLGEAELLHIFQSSMESLNSVAMGPKIKKLDTGSPRYLAKCSGASVEELFTAFASESGQDIRWLCSFANVRNRPITLYLSSTTPQKFFDTASGSVGLLASFEDNQTLINDPVNILSIAEHQKLLTTEAISAWQRFMLSYRNDIRVADAHFAIGFLQQSNDQLPIATSEFRLVANRFMRSELAAYSLLNAAKIKLDMQDTVGARDYLKELYVQYPDSPIFDKAILLLAQTSMAIGDHAYAGQVFRKICTLTISEDYKLAAMLGA
ncbi:MAG: tetratricopeptide repeat protein, partial [Sedimentisphaerales bacterium]|nr:tetratricopeptide repeat protein [Sedimentisphaerales bacterium]